jgi:hypothetical protein
MNELKGADTPRKLLSLDVADILRVRLASVTFDGGALIVEGGNEDGKSSFLQSVDMLFGGGRSIPEDPIHGDKQSGSIRARLTAHVNDMGDPIEGDDDIIVEKIFRRGKSPKLEVKSAGAKLKTPQSILNALLTRTTLDPLAFMSSPEDVQTKEISEIQGVDLSGLEAEADTLYDKRTDANRELKRLEGAAASSTFDKSAPEEEVTVSELVTELEAARAHNGAGDDLDEAITYREKAIGDLEEEIAELEKKLSDARVLLTKHTQEKAKCLGDLSTFEYIDEIEIKAKIENAEAINAAVRSNRDHERHVALADDARADAADADRDYKAKLEEIEKEKAKAADRLPVDGLSISDGHVMYKGKPLAQASSSAKLRISVAIAIEKAKRAKSPVRVLCVDDAEKLDPKRFDLLLGLAEDAGFQLMIARVGDGKEASVVIEDGILR